MNFSRRHFAVLGSGFLSSLAVNLPLARASSRGASKQSERRADAELLASVFAYGLASGDPLYDRVILWTHVTTEKNREIVFWQVATDMAFESIVAEGEIYADVENDHTVKVDAILPQAGTSYYYRFYARSTWSMTGRTRTAALDAQNIRLAVVSCSSIWSGYMNAYEIIAERNDLDLVVHCGDYIYDYTDKNELRNMPYAAADSASINDLASHRRRFRYYRKDPFLRRAHQQHPWAIVWDNHDIWTLATREEAIKAFHEWIPIRAPRPDDLNYIYRSLDYGPLLHLVLLDARHIGRDSAALMPGGGKPSILGEEQFQWLKTEISSSSSLYNLVVNQVLMARMELLRIPLIKKSWASFAGDRDRVLAVLGENTRSSNLVLTGDLHISFAANLELEGKGVGFEFLPSSVTRGNLDESLGGFLAKWGSKAAVPIIKKENPHIQYFEGTAHGYGLIDLTPEGATLELWHVPHQEQGIGQTLAFAAYIPQGAQSPTRLLEEPCPSGLRSAWPAPPELRLYSKGSEWGGLKGEYFDSEERLTIGSRLNTIRLYGGDDLNGMEWIYDDGLQLSAGSLKGRVESYSVEAGEYFTGLTLGIGLKLSGLQVEYIELRTNRDGLIKSGRKRTQLFESSAPKGQHIVGFYGRQKSEVFKLGAVYGRNFEV